jgi:hypothetical protein
MMTNVGGIDRLLRIVVGGAVLALTFVGPYTETLFPWGIIGLVPLLTGIFRWCPVYSLFGSKTCSSH